MCSRKWDIPLSAALSWRAPTFIQTPIATERTESIASPITVRPDGSTVRWKRPGGLMAPEGERSTARWLRTPPAAIAAASSAAAAPAPVTAAGIRVLLRRHVAGERLLPAELDLPFAVDPDHLDEDRVPLVDDVFHALDPLGLQLGDVDEAVLSGRDLDEGAERHHAADDPLVDAPDLRILGDPANDLAGAVPVGPAEGRDPDLAGILDVDLGSRLGADLLDHLAAGSDDLADLVRVDHHDVDARRVRRQLGARRRDGRFHLSEHE